MPSYPTYRLPSTVWHHLAARNIGDDARQLYLYLWSCPHRTYPALYRLPLGYAAADLGWPEARVRAALEALEASELIEYDPAAQVVYVPGAFRAECPMNRRQAAGAFRQVARLPRSRLLWSLLADAVRWAPELAELLRGHLEASVTHPDTLSDTLSVPRAEHVRSSPAAEHAEPEKSCAASVPGPAAGEPASAYARTRAHAREVDTLSDTQTDKSSAAAYKNAAAEVCKREKAELAPWERWYAERHEGLLPGRGYRDRINRLRALGLEDRVVIAALELAVERGATYPAAYACHILVDAYQNRGVRSWDDWQRLRAKERARSGDDTAVAELRGDCWEPSPEQRAEWLRRMAELDRVAEALARGEPCPQLEDEPSVPADFRVTEISERPATLWTSLLQRLRNAKMTASGEGWACA